MCRLALLLCACLPLLAACGEEPDRPPPIFNVKAPRGEDTMDFPGVGMSVAYPANWRLRRRTLPEVFELVSGPAVVAAWAYPREEPLPETDAELEGAKDRLIDAIEERDPGYELEQVAVTQVDGAPAVDVTGEQVLARRRLRTRSVHIFKGEVEYVIEALAPLGDFRLVDERVLTPLLDSLDLVGEVAEDTG